MLAPCHAAPGSQLRTPVNRGNTANPVPPVLAAGTFRTIRTINFSRLLPLQKKTVPLWERVFAHCLSGREGTGRPFYVYFMIIIDDSISIHHTFVTLSPQKV